MLFYNSKNPKRFTRVSMPKLGRTITRLNFTPVMMHDKRKTPHMPLILPAMHTRGKFANQNEK